MSRDYQSVGLVIGDSEDSEEITYCSTCMAVGELNRLKERIWLDSAGKRLPDPPNADDWRQCWTCGLVVPTHEARYEGKISGIQGIETSQNAFDSKKGIILGIDDTLKSRIKKLKTKQSRHPDKEIANLQAQGYELVSYESYTPEPVNQ